MFKIIVKLTKLLIKINFLKLFFALQKNKYLNINKIKMICFVFIFIIAALFISNILQNSNASIPNAQRPCGKMGIRNGQGCSRFVAETMGTPRKHVFLTN